MKDQLITFETAKLAKEKGLNELCSSCYDSKGIVHHNYLENGSSSDTEFRVDLEDLFENFNNYGKTVYSAPTQTILQRWLREVHNIECYAYPYKDHQADNNDPFEYRASRRGIQSFETFEEALENELKEGLKLIK